MMNILKDEIDLKQIGPNKYTTSWDEGWAVGDSELLITPSLTMKFTNIVLKHLWAATSSLRYTTPQ